MNPEENSRRCMFRCCLLYLTYELRRLPALKGALLAVGSALGEVEMCGVNVVFVWETTVHRLTQHLLVPLPVCAGYGHQRVRLEIKTDITVCKPSYRPVPKSAKCTWTFWCHRLFVHWYDKSVSCTHPINVYLAKNDDSDSALTP